MENLDKKVAIWKEAIPRMNEDDLEFILDFPECFDPKMLKMVKARYDKLTKLDDDEEEYETVEDSLEYDVLNILEEMGCSYNYDKDGDLHFEYKDEDFYITVSRNSQFIEIWNYGWKIVDLNNAHEVAKIHQAISYANFLGDISTNYTIREDSNEMQINSGTRSLFFEHIPNRKDYLEYLLDRIFLAHEFVEHKLQLLYEEDYPNEKVN
jgi:hypothetical protein